MKTQTTKLLKTMGQNARAAALNLSRTPTKIKDQALMNIASILEEHTKEILVANKRDMDLARENGLDHAMLGRLEINEAGLSSMARSVRTIAKLTDPVGEEFDIQTLPNGLEIKRRRVPLGVIGAIYESRPNVTVDIASLSLKSGNSVILRGGSEALNSNRLLSSLIRQAISNAGVHPNAVQFVENTDRSLVEGMLQLNEYIDLLIPRGGSELVRRVAREATMPTITGGIGVCHTYVDKSADLNKAVEIAFNAKVQHPTVCNALDTLLVHSEVAPSYLSLIAKRWASAGVEMHVDGRAHSILGPFENATLISATEDDWGKEFLSLTAAVRVVDSLDEAIAHIDRYGSGHSEAILTEDNSAANRFLDDIDAAVVMVNTSTRFNDGAEFGLGSEVAISTNKMHARGPMGLRELTSYKWIVQGTGQIRT